MPFIYPLTFIVIQNEIDKLIACIMERIGV